MLIFMLSLRNGCCTSLLLFNCFNALYMKNIIYLVLALIVAAAFIYFTTPWLNAVWQILGGAVLLTVFSAVYRKLEQKV